MDEIDEIHNFIKNEIQGYENYKILYGGSVKSANSKEILNLDSVDGLLIGGASLNFDEFKKILSFSYSSWITLLLKYKHFTWQL